VDDLEISENAHVVTGRAVCARNWFLSTSDPSRFEHKKSSAWISYAMLSSLFCGKTQLELEAHAAQDVAGAVADRDGVVRAVVE
jgi:hypothetical protein